MEFRTTDTKGFKALARDARGRNRAPTNKLLKRLDITGTHVVSFDMIHNDVEIRCLWMCKVDDSDEPFKVWMDNGIEVFNRIVGVRSRASAAKGGE